MFLAVHVCRTRSKHSKYVSAPADGRFGFAGGHWPASLIVLPSGGRNWILAWFSTYLTFLESQNEKIKTKKQQKPKRLRKSSEEFFFCQQFVVGALGTVPTLDALCALRQNLTTCQATSVKNNLNWKKNNNTAIGNRKRKRICSEYIMDGKQEGVSQCWCTSTTAPVEKRHKLQKCFRLKNRNLSWNHLLALSSHCHLSQQLYSTMLSESTGNNVCVRYIYTVSPVFTASI